MGDSSAPRPPQGALEEIQSDEYGGGRPERIHAELFATSMRGVGLDDAYGACVDDVPALTLALFNMLSMFGLSRRLTGAVVDPLAVFEMTSSFPNRKFGDGVRRLGFGTDVTDYFDEHVEADAVHEQIAARDLAGALAADQPELLVEIMFGAAACLAVDEWGAGHMLEAWLGGETSLRKSEDRRPQPVLASRRVRMERCLCEVTLTCAPPTANRFRADDVLSPCVGVACRVSNHSAMAHISRRAFVQMTNTRS